MTYKTYIEISNDEISEAFSKGIVSDYSISEDILERLSKDIGFSYDVLYKIISSMDSLIASNLVQSLCIKSKINRVSLLVNEASKEVIGYSIDDRLPILNTDFMKRVISLAETSSDIEIAEKYICDEDTKSSVIVKKSQSMIIGESKTEYEIGVLLLNDELSTTSCRLVVFIDGQPIYLPASYYSTSTNRYKKSTGTSIEALEVLMLRVIDDLRDLALESKLQDFHVKYRYNKDILATYEEYNTILRAMNKIPSIIEDHSFIESLISRYDEFEKKYAHIEDKKSSYIFRCTAIGDISIGYLTRITCSILNDLGAPAMEYFNIRDLLGAYLSTNRIAVEIAKEN